MAKRVKSLSSKFRFHGTHASWGSDRVLSIHATTDKEPGETHTREVRTKATKKRPADTINRTFTVQPERVFDATKVPVVRFPKGHK